MPNSEQPNQRLGLSHLDAIRGLASLQVLALHILSAFLPAVVFVKLETPLGQTIHHSPLFLLYDGYTAVYIFFALSGFVLTLAFSRQADRPLGALAARSLRLFLPAFAACLLAFAVKTAFPDAHLSAAALTGSTWLAAAWAPPAGLWYFAKDSLLDPLFLGYHTSYPLGAAALPAFIEPVERAYLAPLWSLSVELQGSVMILALAMCRARPRLWALAFAALCIIGFRSHFAAFLVGHALALAHQRGLRLTLSGLATIALLVVASLLCLTEEFGVLAPVKALCEAPIAFSLPCGVFVQKVYGGALIFAAFAFSPVLIRVLSKPYSVWLGRISFPLYLVHWPLLLGPACALLIGAAPWVGFPAAAALASVCAAAMAFLMAMPFRRLDGFAQDLARRLRDSERTITGRSDADLDVTATLPRGSPSA